MSISGVLNRLSNYHTHLAKHDFLQLRFDYLIPHPTLICPKTITLFFVYELIYVIYLTRLKVFANYLHLLYSNLLIIRFKLLSVMVIFGMRKRYIIAVYYWYIIAVYCSRFCGSHYLQIFIFYITRLSSVDRTCRFVPQCES